MVHIYFIPVLDYKGFYHQGEIYVLVLVCPDYLCDLLWCIYIGVEVLLKRFMQYGTCLCQAIHPFFESEIYVAINMLVVKVILFNDLLGN